MEITLVCYNIKYMYVFIQNGSRSPAVLLKFHGVKCAIHIGSKNYTTYKKFFFYTYYIIYEFNTVIIPWIEKYAVSIQS
jgi:hypothetical protein